MDFIISLILSLFLILVMFLFFLSFANGIIYKVPQVSTFNSDFHVMRPWLKKYDLQGKRLVDLGCGIGRVLRFFTKEFGVQATGYEIDLSNYLIGKILNHITKIPVNIQLKNYLKSDLSQFEVIYIYLYPELMEVLDTKIWSEARPGTLIICNAFQFEKRTPIEVLKDEKWKEEVFIYRI